MRSLVCVCLFVLVCGAFAKNKKDDHKVKIAVYYESLCPDSKKFITSQLAPVWRDFKGVIKVKLVPYGKSTHEKVNGKWEFTCHHGPDECYGNKIQSCILKDKSLADTEKMELVVCLMSQASPDKALDTCAGQPRCWRRPGTRRRPWRARSASCPPSLSTRNSTNRCRTRRSRT